MESTKPHPPEVMGAMGDDIYEQDIIHLVEPGHNEEIVAIKVDSRRWALGANEQQAVNQLRQINPEAFNILCLRVGSRAVYMMRSRYGQETDWSKAG